MDSYNKYGLTEAQNGHGDDFGFERLVALAPQIAVPTTLSKRDARTFSPRCVRNSRASQAEGAST